MVMPYQALPPRSQRLRDWAESRGFAIHGVYWDRQTKETGFRGGRGEEWREIYRGGGEKSWRLGAHYPRFARRVYETLLRERPRTVMVFDLEAAIGCVAAKRRYDFHLIYDIADTFYLRHNFPAPIRAMLTAIEAIVLRAADLVLVPDERRITPIEQRYVERICVIYNCPSLASASDDRTLGARREPGTFLLSGYLTEQRGCFDVLAAAALVPDARIIAAGHAPEPALNAALTSNPQVEFHPWVSHAESSVLFARSQAVFTLYDPRVEINRRAASNKWYDAMMTGTAIIANQELLAARWLEDGDLAYLLPYGDAKSIAACMRRIMDDPAHAERKGLAGRQLFEDEFNWERMQERLDDAFRRRGIALPSDRADRLGLLPTERL